MRVMWMDYRDQSATDANTRISLSHTVRRRLRIETPESGVYTSHVCDESLVHDSPPTHAHNGKQALVGCLEGDVIDVPE
jgi:hypothetical protein